MQTADATPVESSRKQLPEMPYMSIMKPATFTGPKLSTAATASSVTAGDYLYEMGNGRVQSGWLTLAATMRGFGSLGQSATPISYIYPLQVDGTCDAVYLGVIAYPIFN
jgi:hypothetical protein